MKTLNKYIAGISTAALLMTSMSCSKDFYANQNINPNAPVSLLPNLLLTPIEASLAYEQGGDLTRFSGMFIQQSTGAARQSSAYYQYIVTNNDVETSWDNMYTSDMYNDYQLLQICSNGKYNGYKGITEVLMGYSLQIVVDFWGSAPYSDAFKGVTNSHPTYNTDNALYATAITLLNQGIVDLNNTANDLLLPSNDDVIYNGSLPQWTKFAHAELARIYIHQSQTGSGSTAMADSALKHAGLAFTSNADNAQVVFGTSTTNGAPNYQFYQDRADITYAVNGSVDGTFFGMLAATNDPRRFSIIDSVNEVNFNALISYYQLTTSPVEFICYDEIQFISAEATLRTGGTTAAAQTFYLAGIQADIAKVTSNASIYAGNTNPGMTAPPTNAQIATYLLQSGIGGLSSTTNGILSATTATALAQIANQQYIAEYMNPEAWAVWRRSTKIAGFTNGSPSLTPVAGPQIPRRYLYPQSELSLNAANVPSATLYSPRIFWDN